MEGYFKIKKFQFLNLDWILTILDLLRNRWRAVRPSIFESVRPSIFGFMRPSIFESVRSSSLEFMRPSILESVRPSKLEFMRPSTNDTF